VRLLTIFEEEEMEYLKEDCRRLREWTEMMNFVEWINNYEESKE